MRESDMQGISYDEVLARLVATVSEVFGRPVDPRENFFDLGGDSITAVELALRLETDLGTNSDVTDLISAGDLAAFARALTTTLEMERDEHSDRTSRPEGPDPCA